MDSAPVQLRLILPSMARLDLTDEERAELVRELRSLIDGVPALAAHPAAEGDPRQARPSEGPDLDVIPGTEAARRAAELYAAKAAAVSERGAGRLS
jgi:hypothetical protein